VCKQRTDFGSLPNQAQFDADWFEKRQMAIDDPEIKFDPVNIIEDFMKVAMENLIVQWCTRGITEPISITKEDFERGIIKDGEYAGIPYIRLKENYRGQKGKKLSLKDGDSNTNNTRKKTLPCPYSSHPFSCYQTTIRLLEMVPDNCEGTTCIFRQTASKKQIAVHPFVFLVCFLLKFTNKHYCFCVFLRHGRRKGVNGG